MHNDRTLNEITKLHTNLISFVIFYFYFKSSPPPPLKKLSQDKASLSWRQIPTKKQKHTNKSKEWKVLAISKVQQKVPKLLISNSPQIPVTWRPFHWMISLLMRGMDLSESRGPDKRLRVNLSYQSSIKYPEVISRNFLNVIY